MKKEKKQSNEQQIKVRCNRCGYTKRISFPSGGIIDGKDCYGNHSCPNNEMGTFYESE